MRDDPRHYQIGYLGIRDGRTSNFVFLDYRMDENELHHHEFISLVEQPEQLTEVTSTGLSACLWDLRLQAFECEAWLTHVLHRSGGLDYEGYLAATLNADL